jgi:hypothetical protein
MKTPLGVMPAATISPEDALATAVVRFEFLFTSISTKYLDTGSSRTTGGTRFRTVIPGTPDVTQPIPYQDHVACALDWLTAATAVKATMIGKQLLWKTKPHFVSLAQGGFTITSAFAVESVVGEAVPASDDPAHDAPAFEVGKSQ